MSVALIGYRGSGKSTIGRRLADKLWMKFVDVDQLIIERAGRSIREIFQQDGEERFRDLETEAIRIAVAMPSHIIALGGGAPVRAENRRLIKEAKLKVVYLRCEPEELLKRIQADVATREMRPDLTPLAGGLAEIQQVLAVREPIYRQMMDVELDVTRMTPDQALTHIARIL